MYKQTYTQLNYFLINLSKYIEELIVKVFLKIKKYSKLKYNIKICKNMLHNT